jgi:hypothetical protein
MSLPNSSACKALGYAKEYKVDPPRSGTFRLANGTNTVTTVIDAKTMYVDWKATIGIDAVVVKGSTTANVYRYTPKSRADGHLHSPVNASGKFAQISHVSFCYNNDVTSTTSTISGTVWSDYNDNQTFDSDEPVLAGETIKLYLDNGDGWLDEAEDTLVTTTTTDAAGNYTFTNLNPGTYLLSTPNVCSFGIEPIVVSASQTIDADIIAYTSCGT